MRRYAGIYLGVLPPGLLELVLIWNLEKESFGHDKKMRGSDDHHDRISQTC